jgi:hypothetical protein
MKTLNALSLAVAALCATSASAAEINSLQNLSQSEFAAFAQDLTAVASNKSAEPAAPLGITGFDIGVGLSSTSLQNSAAWTKASSNSDTQNVYMTKVVATKGLPWGVDVGGFIAKAPDSNITLSGFNAKFAILEGTAVTPALALRGSYTKLGGVSQLDFSTMAAEALISKGFLGITPYAGVGAVVGTAKSQGTASALSSETVNANKVFAGVSWSLLLANLALEYDRTGSNTSWVAKVGVRW